MKRSRFSAQELEDLRVECGFGCRDAAEHLGVSLPTWFRWRQQGAPDWALRLLRIQAGYPPWDGWDGWSFRNGELWPPGYRQPVTPGQVMAVPYRLQIIAALKRRIREFEGMTDQEMEQHLLRDRHQ